MGWIKMTGSDPPPLSYNYNFDNENDDFCDKNSNNVDENDQKTYKYPSSLVQIYPLYALMINKKKDQNSRAGVDPPAYRQCPFKIIKKENSFGCRP